MPSVDEGMRYREWWRSGPGLPCVLCKQGDSGEAATVRRQGASFYPMRMFGPDRVDRPVRHLLVAMEPSQGWFDDFVASGKRLDDARNFAGTKAGTDSVVQFAARRWLCEYDETFLLTDMAKCGVENTKESPASRTQQFRRGNCDAILQTEAKLYALRTVIAVGKNVRDALHMRSWLAGLPVFRILHWSNVGVAHQKSLFAKLASEDSSIDEDTVEAYRAFINERRTAMGKSPKTDLRIGEGATRLLAVYRRQFGRIRLAISTPAFRGGRRDDGMCCRAVPDAEENAPTTAPR